MRDYAGEFEVHLTTRIPNTESLDQLRRWCTSHGCKLVMIVLSRGRHMDQPMATWRRAHTTLPSVLREANEWAADLGRTGIPVARVKIEAAPSNREIPLHDEQALAHDPRNYFEHHLKLLRDTNAGTGELAAACETHGAHLSRNAFREASPGMEERFVTLRNYGSGRTSAEQALVELLATLRTLDETVLEQESEYCVYDSNLELDAGWLRSPG